MNETTKSFKELQTLLTEVFQLPRVKQKCFSFELSDIYALHCFVLRRLPSKLTAVHCVNSTPIRLRVFLFVALVLLLHGRTENGIFVGDLPLLSYCFDAVKLSKPSGIV